MNRRYFTWTALLAAVSTVPAFATSVMATPDSPTPAPVAADKPHRVAMQIDSDDRRSQALVLGNVHNYAAHYRAKGEPFEVSIVVFGPGYGMVRADMSMMTGQIETLQKDLGGSLKILACQNTRRAIAESEGKKPEDIPLLPGVDATPSGVVALAEMQEAGWAYIRP